MTTRVAQMVKISLLLVFVSLCLAGSGSAAVVDRIVAVVNDEVISLSELEQMIKSFMAQSGERRSLEDKNLQRQMLESLINQKLAKAEAKRRGITVSDKELEKAMQDFRTNNRLTEDEALTQALAKAGITLNELKQQIHDQILQERLIQVVMGGKATVTEADIRRFYDTEYPKESGVRVHLRIMSLELPPNATEAQKKELQEKAELILREHKQGSSWETLRAKYNLPVQDLGYINLKDLEPKLAQFLSKLRPGEVGPIQSSKGFQLVLLADRKAGTGKSYEEAAPEIRRFLMRRDMDKRFQEWIKTVRDRAHIKIML